MRDPRTKEEIMGITADRFEQHHEYYLQLAKAMGIGWPDPENTDFMGRSLERWAKLYEADEHLNNVSLGEFDRHYPLHALKAGAQYGVGWSKCETVCMLKAVIRRAALKSQGRGI
jgi:hypothetical protein